MSSSKAYGVLFFAAVAAVFAAAVFAAVLPAAAVCVVVGVVVVCCRRLLQKLSDSGNQQQSSSGQMQNTTKFGRLEGSKGKSSESADKKSKSERGQDKELTLLNYRHVALEKESQLLWSQLQERRRPPRPTRTRGRKKLSDSGIQQQSTSEQVRSTIKFERLGGSGKSSGTTDEKSKSERGLQEELTLLKDKHGVLEKEKQQLLRQLQELREELEETKYRLRATEQKEATSQQCIDELTAALRVELDKNREASSSKEYIKLPGSDNQQQSSSEQVANTSKFEELEGQFSVPSNLHIKCPVGVNGGLLSIPNTDISLDIPEGALKEECTIDFRAIHDNSQNSEDESFTTNSCVMVELLPNCLQLSAPAKLTLPHCLILSQGVKSTAKVFESHSMQDGKPVWEENCNIQTEVDDSTCHLLITQFCWIKVHINGKTVKAKRIYVFAAKSDKSTRGITNMEVGYYVKLPNAGKIITDNSLKVLQKKEFVFEKEGSKPLRLSFEEVLPSSYWSYSVKKKNPQEISFRSVALSQESSRSFPLIARTGQNWVDSFCYFTAGQGLEEIDLACFLADPDNMQPSLSKQNSMDSMDLNVPQPEASGVVDDTTNEREQPGSKFKSDDVVSEETIRELSKQIGSSCICVARALGLTKTQIDNIKGSNTQQQEISYQVLSKWQETNGFSATKSALVTALQNAGRKDLADNLETPDNNQAAENHPGNEKK